MFTNIIDYANDQCQTKNMEKKARKVADREANQAFIEVAKDFLCCKRRSTVGLKAYFNRKLPIYQEEAQVEKAALKFRDFTQLTTGHFAVLGNNSCIYTVDN